MGERSTSGSARTGQATVLVTHEIAGERQLASIDLNKFKWKPVCGGMYYTPIAA